MINGTVDGKQLKALLIDLKTKALDNERRSTGFTKAVMTAQIQALDAILIFLNSNMTEENMTALKLTLDTTPVPIKQLKRDSGQNPELSEALVQIAEKVPEGTAVPLNNLGDLKMTSVASKMWALRERGVLPEKIVPLQQHGKLYIACLTPEELARRQKSKRAMK